MTSTSDAADAETSADGTRAVAAPQSTTVSRAVRLLGLLAEHPEGLTITELAAALQTQRPPLYRIANSLLDRRLIHRRADARYVLGGGLLDLALPMQRSLEDVFVEPLQRAANAAAAGAVLVLEGADGLVAAVSQSPETTQLHLVTPVGHHFTEGPIAPRLAIEAQRPAARDPESMSALLDEVRDRGYATSGGAAFAGAWAVAFPVQLPEQYGLACAMLVTLQERDEAGVIRAGERMVQDIAARLTGLGFTAAERRTPARG
ncbi:helix-turn-helix domain-containing protein [Leucobacter rhizosphaerae]|uniref:Helix-turn-helix domain-containing protein n=1 Tax=Leucobacter rhizosphaerae TaxID=2932245 RepID=A0ABY4FTD8_9MICO|nr:helix-turn-helix domain-containing protein [Leucobacter rhizosphaerae]UOQ59571.1 helix-turn-helix domain-containing protein [Leucobacter rhizosphaerae]